MATFDLREGSPNDIYRILTNIVIPRPIAFVSTVSGTGVLNLAPFSFFMVGGANPPSLMIAPTLTGTGSEKDSLRNIRENGEFVVNTVHRAMAAGMNEASASLPPHESEWPRTGFTPQASSFVRPPRVAESLAQLECRLFQVIEHGDGPGSARYILGEILAIHVADDWVENGRILPLPLLSRLGGADYLDMQDRETFQLDRPSS